MFIVYSNTSEIFVTTPGEEGKLLELFIEYEREVENYDREEYESPSVQLRTSALSVRKFF